MAANGLAWQANFFDHRLRPDTELEAFARYIFLNPYRKGIIEIDEEWSGWILNREYRPEFVFHLEDKRYPQKEWLMDHPSWRELIDDEG